jgi:hypothetical protein
MRFIGRLIGLAWLGLIVTAIIGAIAAVSAKRRMVIVDEPEANQISLGAAFEPLSFRSTATAFRGGSIECWYGGGVIDLREATLDPAGAHLEIKVVFGGGQLVVPEDWNVTTGVIGIGGIGDARPKVVRRADAPSLTISGTVLFGGFGIASQVSEKEMRGLEQAMARFAERKQHAAATAGATRTEPVEATGPEVVATA